MIPIRDTLTPTGNFPIVCNKNIKGGLHVISKPEERYDIPEHLREIGMLIFCKGCGKFFVLDNGISNSNWKEFEFEKEHGGDVEAVVKEAIIHQHINVIDSKNVPKVELYSDTHSFSSKGYMYVILNFANTPHEVSAQLTMANDTICTVVDMYCVGREYITPLQKDYKFCIKNSTITFNTGNSAAGVIVLAFIKMN